ncbi:hypothetical protein NEDG_00006 [Nematocida displodere]|uniref:RING-type domain-containing protein n=1 Tax=Nematocida displodere TaxID=1805483 RepID=A0A177EJ84_9MICR|nr:hypothetical protein NEDG_00006 [Nematocida displodere]
MSPQHATLKKMLALACAAAATICAAVEEKIYNQYLESPHTARTLEFFGVSGYDLLTRTPSSATSPRIAENQWGDIEIHLNKYTLETIPDEIVQGIRFGNLIICAKYSRKEKAWPIKHDVVEKVLRALGTVYADKLAICSIIDVAAPRKRSSLAPPTCPNTPRLLRVYTPHLELKKLSSAAAGVFLALIDLSACKLVLRMPNACNLTNLGFLDKANPKRILELYVWDAVNLTNIDCEALQDRAVVFDFELLGTTNPVCASPATLQGIASKKWARLGVPADLWNQITSEIRATPNTNTESLQVGVLTLTVHFLHTIVDFVNRVYGVQVFANSLNLRLANRCSQLRSYRTLKNIFGWVSRCFSGVKEVAVSGFGPGYTPIPTIYQYLCIDTILPDLTRLHYEVTSEQTLHLYSTQSILWIAPNTYFAWASGNLNKEMVEVCSENVVFIGNNTATNPFFPPKTPELDPCCFGCQKTVSQFNSAPVKDMVLYLGIVCEKGHMGCNSCLKKLAKKSQAGNLRFCCPHCTAQIRTTGFSGVIRRDKEHPRGHFDISRLDLTSV